MRNIYLSCKLCNCKIQMGPNRYSGHYVIKYSLLLCEVCYSCSKDGIPPVFESIFINHLKEMEISVPVRNKRGFIHLEEIWNN